MMITNISSIARLTAAGVKDWCRLWETSSGEPCCNEELATAMEFWSGAMKALFVNTEGYSGPWVFIGIMNKTWTNMFVYWPHTQSLCVKSWNRIHWTYSTKNKLHKKSWTPPIWTGSAGKEICPFVDLWNMLTPSFKHNCWNSWTHEMFNLYNWWTQHRLIKPECYYT